MKSVHFIMIYNVDGIDNARELAKRELERFGVNNLGMADWYTIAGVYKDDGSEFTCDSFEQKFYNLTEANDLVNREWLQGFYSDEIKAVHNKAHNNLTVKKVSILDGIELSEISLVGRGYENLLETSRVNRKLNGERFSIEKNHEFNPNIYTEFGVTWIVNSYDGDCNYIVTVYQK